MERPHLQSLYNRQMFPVMRILKLLKLGTLDLNDFDLIVIDSKESLDIHKSKDFKDLKAAYPSKNFIITSQSTKSGDYAGDGKWYNEMDTFIYCKDGKASTIDEKNRWGGSGELKMF